MTNRFWMLSSAAVFAVTVAATSSNCFAGGARGFSMGPPTWAMSHIASSAALAQPAMALHNNAAPSFSFHPMPVTAVPAGSSAGFSHMSTTAAPVTSVPAGSGAGFSHMSTTTTPVTTAPVAGSAGFSHMSTTTVPMTAVSTGSGTGFYHMSTTGVPVTTAPTSSSAGFSHMSTTNMPTSADYGWPH